MITSQANFLLSLGWAVVNSLWQLALLWLVYQLITRIYSQLSAAFRSGLAALLLSSGFVWFIFTFITAFSGTTGNEALRITTSLINTESAAPVLSEIVHPVSILYLCLLIIPISRFIKNYRYVQVIRKYGLEKADASWRLFVENISTHMNISRKVEIWVSAFISSPVTVGWLKPVILLPAAMMTQLSTQQVEALLLHELVHIRRFDYLFNLVINFIRTILYFNPFATAFVKIVEREREKSCDKMVLQFQYNPHEYATALLLLQQAANQPRTFLVAATGKDELLQRVELIMGVKKRRIVPAKKVAGILAFVISGIILFGSIIQRPKLKNHTAPVFNFTFAGLEEERPASQINNVVKKIAFYTSTSVNNPGPKNSLKVTEEGKHEKTADAFFPNTNNDIIQAGFEIAAAIPELKNYQKEQVRKTIEASKKVLGTAQWVAVEKELAELFSQQEKKEIRKRYQQQVEMFDWQNWEKKLKAAYEKVDWEQVNNHMKQAINYVRLDSLQQVYNDALARLDIARKELLLDSVKSIPDSEVSLKTLDKKIKMAMSTLSDIKATKKKRIVHL